MRRILATALLAMTAFPSGALAAQHLATFPDVPRDSWASPFIGYLAWKGYISASQPLYRPLDPITRAELAKILVGMRKLAIPAAGTTFCDVPTGHWANAYIEALRSAGIVQGTSGACGKVFEPERPVSRAEALKMVLGTFGIGAPAATASSFTDVPVDAWYAPYVMKAYALGIARGPGNNLFNPFGLVTRQELAKMAVLALNPSDFDPPSGVTMPPRPETTAPPSTPATGSVCGNGKVEYGEYCDDGNTVSGDGCDSVCELEMTRLPVCGNGKCETNEKTSCAKDCA